VKKAAFTGASQPKEGLMAIRRGEQFFLTKSGTSVDRQAKMLRAIQENGNPAVGSTRASHQCANAAGRQPAPGAGRVCKEAFA